MPTDIKTSANQQQRKKILIGITKGNWGGAQRYCFDLATNLARDKFDIVVIAGTPGALIDKLNTAGIRTITIPGLGRDIRWLGELLILKRLISILRSERPDILHLSSPKMAGLGALAGRFLGIPKIIVTVHGWSFSEKRNFFAKSVIWFFSWLTAALANTNITITHADYRAAQKFFLIPKRKFMLIPNGISPIPQLMERQAARNELKRFLDFPDSAFLVGTITELTANKDLPTLIRAVAALKGEAYCIIIGGGEDEAKLKRLVRDLRLEKRVALTGFLAEAQRFLPSFDCFVMSSVKEGLPYAVMEAMAAGVPVVASSVGGLPDLIQDRASGFLVKPGDPAELANSVRELIKNPAKRQQLAGEAKAVLQSKFSFAAMLESTRRLYEGHKI